MEYGKYTNNVTYFCINYSLLVNAQKHNSGYIVRSLLNVQGKCLSLTKEHVSL